MFVITAVRDHMILYEKRFVNKEKIEKILLLVESPFRAGPPDLILAILSGAGAAETVHHGSGAL